MAWWRRVVAAVVVLASAVGVSAFAPASTAEASRVWLQDDVYRGVVGDAPSLNRYAFVEGSPVTFTDVWGFFRSASDVDAFMAAHDPNRGKPWRLVVRDWMEDNPGTVTGMVTGFAFGAVCTLATAGAGLLACAAMGGAISSAIGSSMDYVDQTPASERNWGDYLMQVGPDAAIGAALGVAGEGFGVLLQGAAKPLLTSATRALSDAFTGGVASSTDDIAKVTLRSTWDDVVDGLTTTWNAKVPLKPRATTDAPRPSGAGTAASGTGPTPVHVEAFGLKNADNATELVIGPYMPTRPDIHYSTVADQRGSMYFDLGPNWTSVNGPVNNDVAIQLAIGSQLPVHSTVSVTELWVIRARQAAQGQEQIGNSLLTEWQQFREARYVWADPHTLIPPGGTP